LQSGPGTNPPNMNFHFNPRFDQNAVVKNSCKYGSWGNEERGHLPFQRGQHFDITIHIEHYQFRVDLKNFLTFIQKP
jgi:galectin-9